MSLSLCFYSILNIFIGIKNALLIATLSLKFSTQIIKLGVGKELFYLKYYWIIKLFNKYSFEIYFTHFVFGLDVIT